MNSEISLEQKKRYCCRNMSYLSADDVKDIGRIFIRAGMEKAIVECSDGCRIDLDKLNDENIITTVYTLIGHRLEKLANK